MAEREARAVTMSSARERGGRALDEKSLEAPIRAHGSYRQEAWVPLATPRPWLSSRQRRAEQSSQARGSRPCSLSAPPTPQPVKGLRTEAALALLAPSSGSAACVWEKKGRSGKERQEQRGGHESAGEFPGPGRASKVAGHCRIGVAPSRLKPLLQTPPTVPTLRAGLEGAAPDLLTQVSRGGEVVWERVTGGPRGAAALPCGRQGTGNLPPTPPALTPPPFALGEGRGLAPAPRWGPPRPCQVPLTPTPVPAAMPVGFASVG